ncbi:MAG: c-type cytochrome [Acidimicrobiia bacterium]
MSELERRLHDDLTHAADGFTPAPDLWERVEVRAARTRHRIPMWAMPVLALLPVWLFIYAESMSPSKQQLDGPLAIGEQVWATCAGCHGPTGGGGTGYPLAAGEVRKTFPHFEDQLDFVTNGSPALGQLYGAPDRGRISGTRGGQMIAWSGTFTPEQLAGVVCYERFTLQGLDASNTGGFDDEFQKWCVPNAPGLATK